MWKASPGTLAHAAQWAEVGLREDIPGEGGGSLCLGTLTSALGQR